MSNFNPSIDPANQDTLAGAIKFAFSKMMQQTDGMLPAQVINYDRTTNRVSVQLLIAVVTTGGTQVPRPQLASVPVLVAGGGGYFLSFPLKTGDLGWIIANDRDISLFLQSYTNEPPNTHRVKNFSDGVFIPDVMRNFTIGSGLSDDVVLSSLDGAVSIALGVGQVTITAPLTLINGNLTVTGIITGQGGIGVSGGAGINITGDFSMTGAFGMTGDMLVTGNIGATGSITPFV
jgi:hypothetical protein